MTGNTTNVRLVRITILATLLSFTAAAQFTAHRSTWLISTPAAEGIREIWGFGFGKVLGYVSVDGELRASAWDVTTGEESLLAPTGLRASIAIGFFGETYSFVGASSGQTLVGTSGFAVTLDPGAPYTSSGIIAASGPYQIGSVGLAGNSHAGYWKGSRESFVDLHDASRFLTTQGRAVSYLVQAGSGVPLAGNGSTHALMWRGTSGSVIDLHPIGSAKLGGREPYTTTLAFGAHGQQVVGAGHSQGLTNHALLWNGSAENLVNLHPPGSSNSRARAVGDGVQAGYATFGSIQKAVLWRGSAESFEDLHQATVQDGLNARHTAAEAVDEFGTVAGYGAGKLIIWTPRRVGEAPLLKATRIHLQEGWMLFQAAGIPGRTYRAEMSYDLSAWIEVRTAKSTTGLFYAAVKAEQLKDSTYFRIVEVQ